METKEFSEEFNAEFNTEGVAVTNSKMTSTIKLAANIIEENIQGINSISYNKELKRDLGKTIIGCSWKMNENMACAQPQELPCGLKTSHEVGLDPNIDMPRACPHELFRRRIKEIGIELKKFDDHVREISSVGPQVTMVSQPTNLAKAKHEQTSTKVASQTNNLHQLLDKKLNPTWTQKGVTNLVEPQSL